MNDKKQQINRWMLYVHAVFLLFMGLQGNEFIKFKLLIPSFFLVLYFLLCSTHVIYFAWMNRKALRLRNLNMLEKASLLFVAVCLLYGILSWFGVFDRSAIDDIQFDRSYILRHMVMIGFLPIGLSMYILFLDPQTENTIFKSRLSVMIPLWIAVLLGYFRTTEGCFLFLLLMFIEYSAADTMVRKTVPALMLLTYLWFLYDKGTIVLMFLACFLVMIAKEWLFAFLAKYKVLLGCAAVAAAAAALFFYDPILEWLSVNDRNTWWRFYYWMVQIKAVAARGFLGLGFGTAYATMSIHEVLIQGFVDPVTQELVQTQSVLFTTAQHNSYVNILYRTGMIGFTVFMSINFRLLTQGKGKTSFQRLLMLAFINASILIFFNVGLESPRFLILFYLGFFGAMSLYRKEKQACL